ncbi:MAG: chemotaxis response regulator protein-glutamate methylesterase [Desulfobulbaceae bacterium]|nr:chemotaxis response regulator protein-glutamate methylesterase [Desulfobulbaceae bacterium]MCK5322653.1 chemotaxis response regulator protein-glutamate methylesterase [Desulfobulbaceae bacterium]MCK5437086.1 chemotaxis response regulator protein-glutamate methylesterase [Desulfobulbaceae bacterium]
MAKKPIRVLIVDDSLLARKILSNGLSEDPGIEVVGTAPDAYAARDKIIEYRPDVMTLDVEMPLMNGVEFLKRLMPQYPIPVVMVSALTHKGKRITIEALKYGAVDFVTKPRYDMEMGIKEMLKELRAKIKIASTANLSHWKHKKPSLASTGEISTPEKLPAKSTDKIIAIGASTGGIEAVRSVISRFPPSTPGIVIVQHMQKGFKKPFVKRLDSICSMEVKEAVTGDHIRPGRVLIAPDDQHLRVTRSKGLYQAKCEHGPKVCGHRPSIEVLMNSVADHAGVNAVGVMLTGMGADGADAMVKMRKKGAGTIAQDKKSCVIYGMPRQAYERGGAERLVPLENIAEEVIKLLL